MLSAAYLTHRTSSFRRRFIGRRGIDDGVFSPLVDSVSSDMKTPLTGYVVAVSPGYWYCY